MTRTRGLSYSKYEGVCYCPSCGMWGKKEKWYSYLGTFVNSVVHVDNIAGYSFTTKRCWY